MLDAFTIDLPQYNIYNSSVSPLVEYSKTHKPSVYDENEIKRLIPYAKQTDFILSTFSDIVDDLNYDKEKFENIIYSFDDDYDMLKEFASHLQPKLKIHNELYILTQNILTNLVKVQNELGLIISQHEHNQI